LSIGSIIDKIQAMDRTLIIDCNTKVGEVVKILGWVQGRRDHGKIGFLDVVDRSGVIQVFCTGELIGDLRSQDVVEIEGKVAQRPEKLVNENLGTGKIELQAEKIKVLSKAAELPFDMGGKELDLQLPTLLDFRSLTLRHPKVKAIFKVSEVVIDSFREALKAKDFTEFQAPVIIPQAAEGGSEVFEVKYFEHKAYLAQSPQFYKQILVGVFERVFTVNKTLRAEPSVTTRHLTEATTLDAEFGFIESWTDVMEMAEYVIRYIFERVEKECGEALALYETTVPKVSDKIPRIKLREAQEVIFKRTGRDNRNEPDLEPEDEREICRWSLEEHGSDLVFVTHYPVKKRPFYTFEDPEDPGYTLSFDLLGRGTEWLTGGQRINNLEMLEANAKEWGIDIKKSALYIQAFEFGMPPEGGFSFGSERIIMHILGLENVRQASVFPRDMERVDIRLSTIEDKQSFSTNKKAKSKD
jgi:nondiscriminating aspartyl-tRNA synthetase